MVASDKAFSVRRQELVELLRRRGIRDERVLGSMAAVPREEFISEELAPYAYEDRALPLEQGQTLSQPYMVALMTEALSLGDADSVLEIGTGSGYQTAVLAGIAARIVTVERLPELLEGARQRLTRLGLAKVVEFHLGDGRLGWPSDGPYHAIVVTARAQSIPAELKTQLRIAGKLVLPVGPADSTVLKCIQRTGEAAWVEEDLCGCTFVPLVGAG